VVPYRITPQFGERVARHDLISAPPTPTTIGISRRELQDRPERDLVGRIDEQLANADRLARVGVSAPR
jgi:hypothetical protein